MVPSAPGEREPGRKGHRLVDEENPTAEALTCRQLVELVTAYLEGTLRPPDRVRFEEHIATCRPCTIYLAQMREMLRLLGNLPEESVSPDARETLLAAFRDWKG